MRLGRRLAGHGSSSRLDEPDQRVVFVDCSRGKLRSSRERRIEHVGTISDRRAAAQRCAFDHLVTSSRGPKRLRRDPRPVNPLLLHIDRSIKVLHRTVADQQRECPQTYYSVCWIDSTEEEADSRGWESLADRPSTGSVIVRDACGGRSVELGICRHEAIAVWFFR